MHADVCVGKQTGRSRYIDIHLRCQIYGNVCGSGCTASVRAESSYTCAYSIRVYIVYICLWLRTCTCLGCAVCLSMHACVYVSIHVYAYMTDVGVT